MVEINTENKDGIHFVHVNGEIDAESSIYLDNAFKEALENGERKVITDLTKLKYISSAGLGVFISHLDSFNTEGVKLVLFGISETVKQVFDILGLEKLLQIVKTESEALAAFE